MLISSLPWSVSWSRLLHKALKGQFLSLPLLKKEGKPSSSAMTMNRGVATARVLSQSPLCWACVGTAEEADGSLALAALGTHSLTQGGASAPPVSRTPVFAQGSASTSLCHASPERDEDGPSPTRRSTAKRVFVECLEL